MANRTCRVIFLVITLLVNALDFISDWLFYNSAKEVEKSLVYGPISYQQVTALLVFSIIGSIGFAIEIGVFIFELKKGEDFHGDFLLDLIASIFIWIEDIPQIIISFNIALCREEAISIFQLTKAGIVLVGVVISIVATLIRFCRTYNSKAKVCGVRVFLIFGIIIEGAFAAGIFVLTQTESDNNGAVSFRVPTTVMEHHLSDERYLNNVSLFVHQPDVFDAWNLDTNKKDSALNWLRLVPLYDIKDNKYMSFKINYEHVNIKVLRFAIWIATSVKTTSVFKWTLSECYSLNQETTEITLLPNSSCESATSNSSETFFMDFRFEEPDNGFFYQKRVFGEIFFNMKILKYGFCQDGNYDDPQKNYGSPFYPLSFHYFRVNEPQNEGVLKHLYRDRYNMTRFFRKDSPEITDVATAWKTGWNQCASTGSTGPVLDISMQMRCL